MVRSTCGQACRWQVKLCNLSLTRAIIPEHRHEFLMIKHHTNLRSLYYFTLYSRRLFRFHYRLKRQSECTSLINESSGFQRWQIIGTLTLLSASWPIGELAWRQAVYETSHLRSSSKLSLSFVAGHGSEALKKTLKFLSPYLSERADRTDFLPLC